MGKKWKLLKQAYDNYPKGTIFTWGRDNCISSGEFVFSDYLTTPCALKCVGSGHIVFDSRIWATIVTDERKPLLVSEDGVELFEGDGYFRAYRRQGYSKWVYNGQLDNLTSDCFGIVDFVNEFKLFSTKEAAEKWIEEMNKPKEIEVSLHGYENVKAFVSKDNVWFRNKPQNQSYGIVSLKPSDIEDISHAIKQLKS